MGGPGGAHGCGAHLDRLAGEDAALEALVSPSGSSLGDHCAVVPFGNDTILARDGEADTID